MMFQSTYECDILLCVDEFLLKQFHSQLKHDSGGREVAPDK